TLATNTITWKSTFADDANGAGIAAQPYGWTFGNNAEQFQIDQSSTTMPLIANTAYTMTLRTRDRATPPNNSIPVSVTTVTAQNIPDGIQILSVSKTTITVHVLGNFPNLDLNASGIQVRLTSGQASDVYSDIVHGTTITVNSGVTGNTIYNIAARAFNQ